MKAKRYLCSTFFSMVIIFSCQNEARWYPDAEVTIASQYESTNMVTNIKQIFITCIIHNSSDASISGGAITLQVKTDKREYLQTIEINTKIIPGGKIAVNAIISYIDSSEELQSNGVAVFSSYFD